MDERTFGRRFEGKVAIVTGASTDPGIGTASARRLALEGASVVINARCRGAPPGHRDGAAGPGTRRRRLPGSAESDSLPARLVDTAIDRFGRIDLLVNAVGGAPFIGSALTMSQEDLVRTVVLNTWPAVVAHPGGDGPGTGRGRRGRRQHLQRIAEEDHAHHGRLRRGQVGPQRPDPDPGQRPRRSGCPGQRGQPGPDQDRRHQGHLGRRRRTGRRRATCSSGG